MREEKEKDWKKQAEQVTERNKGRHEVREKEEDVSDGEIKGRGGRKE